MQIAVLTKTMPALIVTLCYVPFMYFMSFISPVLARSSVRSWSRILLKIYGVKYQVSGIENLSTVPKIYATMHTSFLDTFLYTAFLNTETRYIAKSELAKVPVFSTAFAKMGNIFVNRKGGGQSLVDLRADVMSKDKNASFFIHPEGTRGQDGSLSPFKKGLGFIAIDRKLSIIPILSDGGSALCPHKKSIPKSGKVRIFVLPEVSTENWTYDNMSEKLESLRYDMLNALDKILSKKN